MDADSIDAAVDAYREAMTVMEPMRMQVWEERQLTVSQLRLTYLIRDQDNPSLGDLAESLGITGATMSGLVDRLAKRGLVERLPDTTDRRVVRVRLTKEGEELSSDLKRAGHDFLREVFTRMGPKATADLAESMRRFSAATKEAVADGVDWRLNHSDREPQK